MSEAEVLYSDVKFTKGKKNVSASSETTYSEVRIPKTQPSSELPGSQQQPVPEGRSKVTPERVAVALLSALLAAAVIALGVTSYKKIKTMEQLQKLAYEHDALKKNRTERHCEVKCPQPSAGKIGWEKLGRKCYSFSTDKLSWEKSREKCKRQGGDLVVIDSLQEQAFLMLKLKEKMNEPEDKFWIGLTDSEEERKWSWVDGSSLNTSLSFWTSGEPDDWEGENPAGEDCARMGETGGAADLKCWFDTSCEKPHRRICEKPTEPRHLKCV